MAFKANRSKSGMGDWIGATSLWNHPKAQIERTPTVNRGLDYALRTSYREIDEFVDAPPATVNDTVTGDTRPASKAQLSFLKDLFAQRANNPEARAIRLGALSVYKDGRLSVTAASDFISVVKRIPRDV